MKSDQKTRKHEKQFYRVFTVRKKELGMRIKGQRFHSQTQVVHVQAEIMVTHDTDASDSTHPCQRCKDLSFSLFDHKNPSKSRFV